MGMGLRSLWIVRSVVISVIIKTREESIQVIVWWCNIAIKFCYVYRKGKIGYI